jgi:pyruvate/2-oxoglutarate dehydrogenase complex dihydrolipoamide acyltransferase (E2) component
MEVGTIQEWKVAPGDSIAAGDVLAEIETDKATRSFEYQDDGFMAKVRFPTCEPSVDETFSKTTIL